MRPCACDRCDKAGPYTPGQCRPCWVYHNDPSYRTLWGGKRPPRCPHLWKRVRDPEGRVATRVCKSPG